MDFLPHEIIIEILSYLGQCDLSNVAHSCQFFFNFITSSSTLMGKFTIELTPHATRIPLSSANHQNALVQHHQRQLTSTSITALHAFGASLKSLTLNDNHFTSAFDYARLLVGLPRLHTLRLENCRNASECDVRQLPACVLPDLRTLTVRRGSWAVFKALALCTRVVDLRVENVIVGSGVAHFGEFLARNEGLRRLRVSGSATSAIVDFTSSLRFNLERLTIDSLNTHESAEMLAFLHACCLQLRELVVFNAPRGLALKCVLSEMTRLKRLEMGSNSLPTSVNYFHLLPERNHSLRTLVLRGKLGAINVVRGILQHYQGLTSLHLFDSHQDDISELLLTASQSLTRLEHLTVPCLRSIVSPTITFNALQSLEITHVREPDEALHIALFLAHSPHVRRLTIGAVSNAQLSNAAIERILTRTRELRELNLGRDFEFDEQAMNIVKGAARHLKRFTIFTSHVERTRTMAERIHGDGLSCKILSSTSQSEEEAKTTQSDAFNSEEELAARLAPAAAALDMNNARMRRLARRRLRALQDRGLLRNDRRQREEEAAMLALLGGRPEAAIRDFFDRFRRRVDSSDDEEDAGRNWNGHAGRN